MGGVRKATVCSHCPWSVALRDPVVSRYLGTYGLVERFGKWPPGREDPRVVEAMIEIAAEHGRITAEKTAKP